MGYRVKKLPYAARTWKLQFIDYRGEKPKIRDVPETEYARLGFRPDMKLDEANHRKDQLNAQSQVKAVEAKRAAISRRMDADERVLNAFLNAEDVQDFEETVLYVGRDQDKKRIVWKAARRLIADLRIEPQKWNYRKITIYEWLRAKQYSPSYSQKVIMVLNQWGEYQAMKYGFYFKQVDFPTGEHLYRISDAYYEKNPDGRASEPLTPDQLKEVSGKMKPEWHNWFYISLWFGLRPEEVDQLHEKRNKRTWDIVEAENVDGKAVTCLQIYQKKLVKIAPERRNKRIPVFTAEQKKALEMIKSGKFQRPSHLRFVEPYLGKQTYLYAGRKGFSLLMRKLGQSQVNYSRWLGHTTTDRTEKDYEQREVVEFRPVKLRRVK